MRELRKIKKVIREYHRLLSYDQQNAKDNKEKYISDIEMLKTFIETYIKTTADVFEQWCNVSVEVFESSNNTIFEKLERSINMRVVNYYLNKLSYQLSKAGVIQRELEEIETRFMQYKYLC